MSAQIEVRRLNGERRRDVHRDLHDNRRDTLPENQPKKPDGE
jgi:hypothetical protein